jgi:hypothetical protein
MQIFVNNQKLEAQFSGMENLAEIYEEMDRWSLENKRYIIGFMVDQKEIPVRDLTEWGMDKIDRLDFMIGDEMDMVLATIEELDRYVDQIGSTLYGISELRENQIGELQEGVHWIFQIMDSLSSILRIDLSKATSSLDRPAEDGKDSMAATLQNLKSNAEGFEKENSMQSIDLFLENLRVIKYFVMKLQLQMRALAAGIEELIELAEEFHKSIPRLTDEAVRINELFQSGKDRLAMDDLDKFTGRLHYYISALYGLDYRISQDDQSGIFQYEVDGIPFHTVNKALAGLLSELSMALEESDIVTVGDIIEYELTDRLKEFEPYLNGICQLLVARK